MSKRTGHFPACAPVNGLVLVPVAGQRRAVVAQPADLDAVMLDRAPGDRQEVEHHPRVRRDLQPPRAGGPVGEHLRRRQLQPGDLRLGQPGVRPAVVDPLIHSRITCSSSLVKK